MTPTQAITTAAERLTVGVLRAAAAVPVKADRMPALLRLLGNVSPTLAGETSAAHASGIPVAQAVRQAFNRYLTARTAVALQARGLSGYQGGGLGYDIPPGGCSSIANRAQQAMCYVEMARQGLQITWDVATDVMDMVEEFGVDVPGYTSPGGGTAAEPPASPWGAAGSLVSSVGRSPSQQCVDGGGRWQDGRCMTQAEYAAWATAQAAGGLMPSTGLFGSMPTWLLGAGIGGVVYGAYRLFFAKKKRRGKAA